MLLNAVLLTVLLVPSQVRFAAYHAVAQRVTTPDIVFIGDSLTANGGVWGPRIGRYGLDVWNLGHGGMTTRQILSYAEQAAKLHPRLAFVMAGRNDVDSSVPESWGYYQKLLDTLIEAGVEPVIQLTLFAQHDMRADFVTGLNARLIEYAKQHGLRVIDLNKALAPDGSLLPIYTTDGTHLTAEAYDVWAKMIRKNIQL